MYFLTYQKIVIDDGTVIIKDKKLIKKNKIKLWKKKLKRNNKISIEILNFFDEKDEEIFIEI